MKLNENYFKLKDSYLFSTIASKVEDYKKNNPNKELIKLGIGDVTIPICKAAVDAGIEAVKEMGNADTFRGYGPEHGYLFLREAVKKYYYDKQIELDTDEIFISDGAKSDLGNILDLFDAENTALIPDPVYPVYVDTNVMRAANIKYISATQANGFLPLPDETVNCDIIYICSPNNPTGAVYNKEQLKKWVDYAKKQNAIILYDNAYEFYITDKSLPRSVYEIEGAKDCSIEFNSLSKTAGFTGIRCGYTIVPKNLGRLNKMWLRRQTTKFNGVPYIVQRMAEAVFSEIGQKQISDNVGIYMKNATLISETLNSLNIWHTGGINSPYIWLKCPNTNDSWEFFDVLLNKANIIGTPGAGFGKNGEGFFRLTAFNNYTNTKKAMEKIYELFKK